MAAGQDPGAAGADEAGCRESEVLNVRECLHHAASPQVQHLASAMLLLSNASMFYKTRHSVPQKENNSSLNFIGEPTIGSKTLVFKSLH